MGYCSSVYLDLVVKTVGRSEHIPSLLPPTEDPEAALVLEVLLLPFLSSETVMSSSVLLFSVAWYRFQCPGSSSLFPIYKMVFLTLVAVEVGTRPTRRTFRQVRV